MRTSLRLLAFLSVVAIPGVAFAGDQDFTLKNKTGYQIDNVFISPHSSDDWGKDVLGKGSVIEDGDSTDITFSRNNRICNYDMMVQYHDNDKATWKSLNLCEISSVTLNYNRSTGATRATTE